ncbi:YciI family protein [Streptomyces sp. NPDC046939]|uniref:YciI family protein n=1 Tax=Streptomyces sp. NPDC046939 TaxID=3155376 RepID=UPI0033FA5DA8
MLHLLSLHYTASEQQAEPFVRDHVAYLERHHEDGTFLISGQTVPTSLGGVIIARDVDRPTIERIAAQDPFVLNDVAEYTITTITPGRMHPDLTRVLGIGDPHGRAGHGRHKPVPASWMCAAGPGERCVRSQMSLLS